MPQTVPPNEIDIRMYWLVFRRRWRLIGAVTVVVFLFGAAYTFSKRPLYRGEATVVVEDEKMSQLQMLEGMGGLSGAIPVETEMEIIKSRTIAEQVVRELGLDARPHRFGGGARFRLTAYDSTEYHSEDRPVFRVKVLSADGAYEVRTEDGDVLGSGNSGEAFRGRGVSWLLELSGYEAGAEFQFTKIPFDVAVAGLREHMQVSEVSKKTNVVRITADLPDPFLARETTNRITGAYLAQNIARKNLEASQTLKFIEEQLESIKGNLEKGEQELDQYKTEKGIFVLSESAEKLIDQISKLEINRSALTLQQREFAQLVKALDGAKENDAPYILGQVSVPDPVLGEMVGELSKRLVELRGLRQDFTDDNPRVRNLQAGVDELKAKVRLIVGNAKRSLDNQAATVQSLIENYENRLKRLPEAERRLASLTRHSIVNADLYTFLLKKHEEARIGQAGIVGNVRILDSSLVPDEPVSPKRKRNLVLAIMAGLILGVMLAFFIEFADDSIRDIEEVEHELALNVFGVIPFDAEGADGRVAMHRLDSRSPIREAFRSLRTNIQFSSGESKLKTLLCTSAIAGAGKTTLTVNLAITLAQAGAKVLVVDCDLRRPQVHGVLGLALEPGLTNALSGAKTWGDLLQRNIEVENLKVLTAGTIPPNPAEFLSSSRFAAFLKETEKDFDFVLFDAPPVVVFTDAAIIGALVDAVFLVIDVGHARVRLAKRAIDSLRNVKANLKGALLNKVKPQPGHDPAEYYYSYYTENASPERPLDRLVREVKERILRL